MLKASSTVVQVYLARIAATYKDKKKVETKDGKEITVYEYSDRQISRRHNEKAERLDKLRTKITDLRAKVKKDLTSKDEDTRMIALAVALMDETFERVGNESSASEGHYGVTGWLVKHVKINGSKATVTYVGKSGVSHKKEVTTPHLVKAIKEAMKGKDPSDSLTGDIGAPEVNQYLKDFGISAKDIRGYRANSEMQDRLKEIRSKGGELPKDRKEREQTLKDEFKEALEETADAVGHTPSQLRTNYLVPGLEDEFLKHGEVSKELKKKATKTTEEKQNEKRLSKPAPKYKPPRHDLRNNILEEPDKDLEGGTAETDKDMSLNYKKVASRVLDQYLRNLVAAEDLPFPPQEEIDALVEGAPEDGAVEPDPAVGGETPPGDGGDTTPVEESAPQPELTPVSEILKPDAFEFVRDRLQFDGVDPDQYLEASRNAKSNMRSAFAGARPDFWTLLDPEVITNPFELACAVLGFRFTDLDNFGSISRDREDILRTAKKVFQAGKLVSQRLLEALLFDEEGRASEHPDMVARRSALKYALLLRGVEAEVKVAQPYLCLLKEVCKEKEGLGPLLLKAPGLLPSFDARMYVKKVVRGMRPEQWARILPESLVPRELLSLVRSPTPYMTDKHRQVLRTLLSDLAGVDVLILSTDMPEQTPRAKQSLLNVYDLIADGSDTALCAQAAQVARVALYEDLLEEYRENPDTEGKPVPQAVTLAKHIFAQAAQPENLDPLHVLKSDIHIRAS